jgi:ABC-type bacteriocin/lantibiotic exporter with double-glycine peptidase domain
MKSIRGIIFGLIKPYLRWQIIGFVLTVVYAVAVFASPLVSRYLIDEVIPAHSLKKLYFGIIVFCLVLLSQPLVGYLKDIVFLHITENIVLDIRKRLFNKLLLAPLSFFNRSTKGEIISRVVNDGKEAGEFISDFFIIAVKNIILIALIIAGMLYLSISLTMIVILVISFFSFLNFKLSKKLTSLSSDVQRNRDRMCTAVNQTINSIMTVKAFLLEKKERQKYGDVLEKTFKDNLRIWFLAIILNNVSQIIVILSLCVIYGLGSISVMRNRLTLGDVVALGLYFQLMVQPVNELLANNIELRKNIPIFKRIDEYLEMESEYQEDAEKERLNNLGEIVIKDLGYGYEDGTEVLSGVNMVFPPRGLVALIGASGSGKSTLVKLLLGLYKPTSGDIYVNGLSIRKIDLEALREQISIVAQEMEFFNESIKENIRCGKPDATDEEITELCKKLKIHEKILSLPLGYDSVLMETVNLSGGEKQRLAMARALIKNPSVFIFDEPTSALDKENEARIREIIETVSKERLVIVIAHKASTIVNADFIYAFKDKRVVKVL